MEIEVLTDRKIVKQSNVLNTAKYNLSAVAIDILHVFLAQILQEDKNLKTYRIKISELEEKLNRRLNRKYLDIATDELMSNFIRLKRDNGDIYKLNWASACLLSKNYIEFKASDELKEFVLNLKNYFVQINYVDIAKLKTFYAKRLYMLFSQFVSSGYYVVKVTDLKYILDIENKASYKDYYDFKKRVVLPSIEQVNKLSNLSVSFNEIKEGKKIERLEFFIEKKVLEEKIVTDSDIVKSIISYFKEITYSKERMTVNIKNRIKELLKEYSENEIKITIKYFYNKWKDDPEFSKYITLKTLLNSKFEDRLIEAETFVSDYEEALDLLNQFVDSFQEELSKEVPDFSGLDSLPFIIIEKLLFWNRKYSNEEIIETIRQSLFDSNQNPKIAKYISISKILDRKFPERVLSSKKEDPLSSWLNK
jgi:hypothetical protein